MRSVTPNASMAASVSPPPAMENADDRATARAISRVPAANGASSKTPTGPFHTTVAAESITSPYARAVSGPMSRIISPGPTSFTALTTASADSEGESATTTSLGMGTSPPRPRTARRMRTACSTRSGSYSEAPTSCPAAAMKVLAMPPPAMSRSTRSESASSTPSLVDTFEPPTIATSGRAGRASAVPSASSSAASRGPAQAAGANRATPWVEACARCADPNASIT